MPAEIALADVAAPSERAFFGHPSGLAYLAFMEAFERLPATTFWLVHAGFAAAAGLILLALWRPLNRVLVRA